TGWAAMAAAASPVTITVRSSASCRLGLVAGVRTLATVRSAAPRRAISPPATPDKISAARPAQRLPTAALAMITRGRGVSSTTAVAASRGRWPVSLTSALVGNGRRRRAVGDGLAELDQRFEQLDRQRQDHGGVLLGPDLDHGLQEPQLERALLG